MNTPSHYAEVRCPECGWVHVSVPVTVVSDGGSQEQQERYYRCFRCRAPSATFVPAGPDDAPIGATLQPVVIPSAHSSKVLVIALDLEGTLISSAVSQFPRPHLFDFLTGCQDLVQRIVMFTTVSESRFRSIAELLVRERHAPTWFASVEYVAWSGPRKDLSFVPLAKIEEVLLVDDVELYVQPSQREQWVPIQGFEPPGDDDVELVRVLHELRKRIGFNRNGPATVPLVEGPA
ncbi:NIF family HAD-type phosphatase [Pseudorhodoferax sp. Leaf267]|uniref:NIF family HAD-type phosphatase n=1 Tax=Pseudorhodoferax sp. Leaf267 TaxID=1736316 RepID=UPI0009EAEEF1|nr:NIF family HAD-type phosphatase [Pseudorhodoferax sp. Leaf267]